MKTFQATKTYYVHEFKAIQDWFGNRGIAVGEDDLKEWCYDGYFLYIVPSDSADEDIRPSEENCDVVVFVLQSEFIETCEEMPYNQSPFALRSKNGLA